MAKTTLIYTEVSDWDDEETERGVMFSENTADLTIDDFIFKFIKPLLRGVGYSEELIDKYI